MRDGTILRHAVQWDMTRTAPESFGRAFDAVDVVVIEATGNRMAGGTPAVAIRGAGGIANPLQVNATADLHVVRNGRCQKTAKPLRSRPTAQDIDAATERLWGSSPDTTRPCGTEQGSCDPCRTSGPDVPECRFLQPAGAGVAGAANCAGGRACRDRARRR